jgi:putative exosortase-associated protein (TIGR04073 family)
MRKSVLVLAIVGVVSIVFTGCMTSSSLSGPERKLGRGISNFTEIARGGEFRRSMEQTAIFAGPDVGYTTGFIHGVNRTISRSAVGVYEIFTFPIANGHGKDYGPIFHPEHPVYPDSYRPSLIADQMFAPDANLGFSGGEVAPFIPGSRFKIFDN